MFGVLINELKKDGIVERRNLLNPKEKPKKSYVQKCLDSELYLQHQII